MPQTQHKPNIWNQVALTYEEYSYHEKNSNYPANKYRAKILLDFFKAHPKGRILDAGCGTGFMTREMLKRGYEVVSVDLAPQMLSVAKTKVEKEGLKGEFHQANVTDLTIFSDDSFDYVMLNGVLPYISEQDEIRVYHELGRLLKPGGFVLASHYNLFFDFFRLDKYTTSAIMAGLFNGVKLNGHVRSMTKKISDMLTHSNFPHDDRIMKTENPIAFKEKLLGFNFTEVEQSYYNFYCLPPRIKTEEDKPTRIWLEEHFAHSWQGLFLAKTFVSIARKLK